MLLQWLSEIGADEAVSDTAVNRFHRSKLSGFVSNLGAGREEVLKVGAEKAVLSAKADIVAADRGSSSALQGSSLSKVSTLGQLRELVDNFEQCALKRTATKTVFSDGNSEADVMLVGEAPGAEFCVPLDLVGRGGIGCKNASVPATRSSHIVHVASCLHRARREKGKAGSQSQRLGPGSGREMARTGRG